MAHKTEARDPEGPATAPGGSGAQARLPGTGVSAVLALDTACACPGAAPGTREAAVILEVPAAPGSNQLPLEEAAVKPPDADAGFTAWGSVLAPGRERRSTPYTWPHSAGMAPLLPLLLFDLHPLSLVSTNKKKPGGQSF